MTVEPPALHLGRFMRLSWTFPPERGISTLAYCTRGTAPLGSIPCGSNSIVCPTPTTPLSTSILSQARRVASIPAARVTRWSWIKKWPTPANRVCGAAWSRGNQDRLPYRRADDLRLEMAMQEHTKTLFLSSLAKIFRKQLKPPGRLLQFLPWEMRAFVSLLLGVTAILLIAVPVVADSQARIVRLSELEGDVQIDPDIGQGFETAVMNLPITQGTKLRAGYDGFAEIEFEDGSTLRFTPGTIVEISQLVLRDSGAKATTVNVLDGVAYVNYEGTKNDEFLLTFGDQKVPLIKSEHVRLEVGHSKARLSVLGGATVQADGPNGTAQVERK